MSETDKTFVICSSEGAARIEFSDLEADRFGRASALSVRLIDVNLDAAIRVDAWASACLGGYFEDLAAHWQGWEGSKEWSTLEQELLLAATHDGRGHITLRIVLHGGVYPHDWKVWASVATEAGLLDRIASDCRSFSGKQPGWF